MADVKPLSAEDAAQLSIERKGALIYRLRGDVGGGDGSAWNYGLWCGNCQALLGRLGLFALKKAGVNALPYGHRTAHCSLCHHTTLVRSVSREDVVAIIPGTKHPRTGECICLGLHGSRGAERDANNLKGDNVTVLDVGELVEKNRRAR